MAATLLALSRLGLRPCARLASSSAKLCAAAKPPVMSQVEVDEPAVKQQLDPIELDMIARAEKSNAERALRHRKARRGEGAVAGFCALLVVSIYSYTIYAMKQESFLDDFQMPELDEKPPGQQGQ